MVRLYIGIGSNIERAANIRAAVKAMCDHFGTLMLSRVYENQSIGFEGQNFYNLVAGVDTDELPEAITAVLHAIEQKLGRVRGASAFTSRTIDLDILIYGDRVEYGTKLRVPHPDILNYACVLRPLAELAPNHNHPLNGKSFSQLWANFPHASQPLIPVPLELTDICPQMQAPK